MTNELAMTQEESGRIAAAVNASPENTLTPTPSEIRESRSEDAFNAVLEREAQERGEKPAFVGKKGKLDQAQAVAGKSETKPEAKGTAVQDKGDSAYEQAVKALRLDGYRPEDLEVLGRDRLIALGESASKRQSAYSQKLEELSKKAAQGEAAAPKVTEPAKDQASPAASQPFNLKEAAKPLLELLGDDAEPALAKYAEAVTSPLRSELEQMKSVLSQMADDAVNAKVMQMRGKLPDEIRGLTDDAEYETKVAPKALQMYATGQYESFMDALREATLLVAGPRILSEAAEFRARKAEQRENGQFHSTETKTPQKSKSWDDRAFAAFKAIERGASIDEARSVFGG